MWFLSVWNVYSVRYECGPYNTKTDKEAFEYVRMTADESDHLASIGREKGIGSI